MLISRKFCSTQKNRSCVISAMKSDRSDGEKKIPCCCYTEIEWKKKLSHLLLSWFPAYLENGMNSGNDDLS